MRTPIAAALFLLCALSAQSAEFTWTRMTGQYPMECAPVLWDRDGDGTPEILALNRLGQLMLWDKDGKALGDGQDGTVATFPADTWTSSPTLVDFPYHKGLVAVSKEGLVIAVDTAGQTLWHYKLEAETAWARANVRALPGGAGLLIGDMKGLLHCLALDGTQKWSFQLPGAVNAQATILPGPKGDQIAVAAGHTLSLLDSAGTLLWQTALGKEDDAILTSPVVLDTNKERLLLCTAGAGALCAVGLDGAKRWETSFGAETDDSLVVLPNATPEGARIFCTGLWGNLYAFNEDGQHLWTSLFRIKTRARPLLLDADGDGTQELFIPCQNQHAYLYSLNGEMLDDIRTNGLQQAPAVLYPTSQSPATALLISSGSLLAHAVKFTAARHVYENERFPVRFDAERAKDPHFELSRVGCDDGGAYIDVRNEHRHFRRETCRVTPAEAPAQIQSILTLCAWRRFPLNRSAAGAPLTVEIKTSNGDLVSREESIVPAPPEGVRVVSEARLRMSATNPFDTFDPGATPSPHSTGQGLVLSIDARGGALPASLAISSTYDAPVEGRLDTPEGSAIVPQQIGSLCVQVATPATNGEQVWDALRPMEWGDKIVIPAHGTTRIWLWANAALKPPNFVRETGELRFTPTNASIRGGTIRLSINHARSVKESVQDLKYCTWDYIPNKWFPDHTPEVIAEMTSHGVNVFPRTRSIPTAKLDTDGTLTMDYTVLDEDLALLAGQTILFQVGHPSIALPDDTGTAARHAAEIAFFHRWRDYMKAKGWDYGRYAFYINDEPGLDYGKSIPTYLELAQLFREADPKFRIYVDPVARLAWDDFEKLFPYIDVWCPNMRLVSGLLCKDPRIEKIMASGKPVWSYECVAQVKSLSPLLYNRANGWRAYYFGLSGVGRWTFSTTGRDHWLPGKAEEEEFAMVYPGETPVRSVRWEADAQGIRDYHALRLQKESKNAGLVLEMMERSDDAYVHSRDYLKEGDRRIWEAEPGLNAYFTVDGAEFDEFCNGSSLRPGGVL